jgi:hypothetical protein
MDGKPVTELIGAGLWREVHPDRWLIVDYADTQSTAAQLRGLDHKRRMDRERQARRRAHLAGDHSLCQPDHCPFVVTRDITRDVSRDVTRDDRRDT